MILSLNSKTFDAIFVLLRHLKEKENNVLLELRRVEKLLSDYELLDKNEFAAISTRYKFLKRQIVHMEWTLNELVQP